MFPPFLDLLKMKRDAPVIFRVGCASGEFCMPLYEYHRENCGKVFELLRRMSDSDCDVSCPDCRSQKVDRQFSTFSAGGCGSGGARGGFT